MNTPSDHATEHAPDSPNPPSPPANEQPQPWLGWLRRLMPRSKPVAQRLAPPSSAHARTHLGIARRDTVAMHGADPAAHAVGPDARQAPLRETEVVLAGSHRRSPSPRYLLNARRTLSPSRRRRAPLPARSSGKVGEHPPSQAAALASATLPAAPVSASEDGRSLSGPDAGGSSREDVPGVVPQTSLDRLVVVRGKLKVLRKSGKKSSRGNGAVAGSSDFVDVHNEARDGADYSMGVANASSEKIIARPEAADSAGTAEESDLTQGAVVKVRSSPRRKGGRNAQPASASTVQPKESANHTLVSIDRKDPEGLRRNRAVAKPKASRPAKPDRNAKTGTHAVGDSDSDAVVVISPSPKKRKRPLKSTEKRERRGDGTSDTTIPIVKGLRKRRRSEATILDLSGGVVAGSSKDVQGRPASTAPIVAPDAAGITPNLRQSTAGATQTNKKSSRESVRKSVGGTASPRRARIQAASNGTERVHTPLSNSGSTSTHKHRRDAGASESGRGSVKKVEKKSPKGTNATNFVNSEAVLTAETAHEVGMLEKKPRGSTKNEGFDVQSKSPLASGPSSNVGSDVTSDCDVACLICHGLGDMERMVLCDACSAGCHTFCMRPARLNVPLGVWMCPDCHVTALKHKIKLADMVRFRDGRQCFCCQKDGPGEVEHPTEKSCPECKLFYHRKCLSRSQRFRIAQIEDPAWICKSCLIAKRRSEGIVLKECSQSPSSPPKAKRQKMAKTSPKKGHIDMEESREAVPSEGSPGRSPNSLSAAMVREPDTGPSSKGVTKGRGDLARGRDKPYTKVRKRPRSDVSSRTLSDSAIRKTKSSATGISAASTAAEIGGKKGANSKSLPAKHGDGIDAAVINLVDSPVEKVSPRRKTGVRRVRRLRKFVSEKTNAVPGGDPERAQDDFEDAVLPTEELNTTAVEIVGAQVGYEDSPGDSRDTSRKKLDSVKTTIDIGRRENNTVMSDVEPTLGGERTENQNVEMQESSGSFEHASGGGQGIPSTNNQDPDCGQATSVTDVEQERCKVPNTVGAAQLPVSSATRTEIREAQKEGKPGISCAATAEEDRGAMPSDRGCQNQGSSAADTENVPSGSPGGPSAEAEGISSAGEKARVDDRAGTRDASILCMISTPERSSTVPAGGSFRIAGLSNDKESAVGFNREVGVAQSNATRSDTDEESLWNRDESTVVAAGQSTEKNAKLKRPIGSVDKIFIDLTVVESEERGNLNPASPSGSLEKLKRNRVAGKEGGEKEPGDEQGRGNSKSPERDNSNSDLYKGRELPGTSVTPSPGIVGAAEKATKVLKQSGEGIRDEDISDEDGADDGTLEDRDISFSGGVEGLIDGLAHAPDDDVSEGDRVGMNDAERRSNSVSGGDAPPVIGMLQTPSVGLLSKEGPNTLAQLGSGTQAVSRVELVSGADTSDIAEPTNNTEAVTALETVSAAEVVAGPVNIANRTPVLESAGFVMPSSSSQAMDKTQQERSMEEAPAVATRQGSTQQGDAGGTAQPAVTEPQADITDSRQDIVVDTQGGEAAKLSMRASSRAITVPDMDTPAMDMALSSAIAETTNGDVDKGIVSIPNADLVGGNKVIVTEREEVVAQGDRTGVGMEEAATESEIPAESDLSTKPKEAIDSLAESADAERRPTATKHDMREVTAEIGASLYSLGSGVTVANPVRDARHPDALSNTARAGNEPVGVTAQPRSTEERANTRSGRNVTADATRPESLADALCNVGDRTRNGAVPEGNAAASADVAHSSDDAVEAHGSLLAGGVLQTRGENAHGAAHVDSLDAADTAPSPAHGTGSTALCDRTPRRSDAEADVVTDMAADAQAGVDVEAGAHDGLDANADAREVVDADVDVGEGDDPNADVDEGVDAKNDADEGVDANADGEEGMDADADENECIDAGEEADVEATGHHVSDAGAGVSAVGTTRTANKPTFGTYGDKCRNNAGASRTRGVFAPTRMQSRMPRAPAVVAVPRIAHEVVGLNGDDGVGDADRRFADDGGADDGERTAAADAPDGSDPSADGESGEDDEEDRVPERFSRCLERGGPARAGAVCARDAVVGAGAADRGLDAAADVRAEVDVGGEAGAGARVEAVAGLDSDAGGPAELEPDSEAESDVESAAEAESEDHAGADVDVDVDVDADADVDADTEADSETRAAAAARDSDGDLVMWDVGNA